MVLVTGTTCSDQVIIFDLFKIGMGQDQHFVIYGVCSAYFLMQSHTNAIGAHVHDVPADMFYLGPADKVKGS